MDSGDFEQDMAFREFCANGVCMKTTDVEAKLDEGNIQEAESSLREGLSLNFEVMRGGVVWLCLSHVLRSTRN